MHRPQVHIDWNYSGKPDLTVGSDAVRAEKALAYGSALILPALYITWSVTGKLDWSFWQYALAMIIGADVGAGAVANALNSCKRFYHTPQREDEGRLIGLVKNPLVSSALHIYPILAGLLYGRVDLLYGLGWYVLLMLAAIVVVKAPLYLQRPVAVLILMLAFLLNGYVIAPIQGWEWLAPILFGKIVLGHLVREEPYRPA
jgi:hypothetical protein